MAGIHTMQTSRILVTKSPVIITPEEIPYPTIQAILDGMFDGMDVDQRPYLYSWLHIALLGVYDQLWSQGQVLALAGPRNAGKSLLLSPLVGFGIAF